MIYWRTKMPNPKKDETKSKFISRCMGIYGLEGKDLKDPNVRKQCLAICYSKFKVANEDLIERIDFVTEEGMSTSNITGNGDVMMKTVFKKNNLKKKIAKRQIKPINIINTGEIGINEKLLTKYEYSKISKEAAKISTNRKNTLDNGFENRLLNDLKNKFKTLDDAVIKVDLNWKNIGQNRFTKQFLIIGQNIHVSVVVWIYLNNNGIKIKRSDIQLYEFDVDDAPIANKILSGIISVIKRHNIRTLYIRDIDEKNKDLLKSMESRIKFISNGIN